MVMPLFRSMYNTEKKRFDCQARAGNEWYIIAHCSKCFEASTRC